MTEEDFGFYKWLSHMNLEALLLNASKEKIPEILHFENN